MKTEFYWRHSHFNFVGGKPPSEKVGMKAYKLLYVVIANYLRRICLKRELQFTFLEKLRRNLTN